MTSRLEVAGAAVNLSSSWISRSPHDPLLLPRLAELLEQAHMPGVGEQAVDLVEDNRLVAAIVQQFVQLQRCDMAADAHNTLTVKRSPRLFALAQAAAGADYEHVQMVVAEGGYEAGEFVIGRDRDHGMHSCTFCKTRTLPTWGNESQLQPSSQVAGWAGCPNDDDKVIPPYAARVV